MIIFIIIMIIIAVPQSSNGNLIIQPAHPDSGWVKPNSACMGRF